jgi:hypothetical protein
MTNDDDQFINYIRNTIEKNYNNDDDDDDFSTKNIIGIIFDYIEKRQQSNIASFSKSGILYKKNKTFNIVKFNSNDQNEASNIMIDHIINPSFCPLIKITEESNVNVDFWNRPYIKSNYQLLPVEFKVSINGRCKIDGIIKDNTFAKYSNKIQIALGCVLPLLDDVWININGILKTRFNGLNLSNKNIQIITKIFEVSLEPNQIFETDWQFEGLPHENIVATSMSITKISVKYGWYQTVDTNLFFKRPYTINEINSISDILPNNSSTELIDYLNNTDIPLGKISIKTPSCCVFPNSYMYKLIVTNKHTEQIKFNVTMFNLINPNKKIVSTNDVPSVTYNEEDYKKFVDERSR